MGEGTQYAASCPTEQFTLFLDRYEPSAYLDKLWSMDRAGIGIDLPGMRYAESGHIDADLIDTPFAFHEGVAFFQCRRKTSESGARR